MNKIVYYLIIKLTFISGCFSMGDEKIVRAPSYSDTFLDFYYKYTGKEEIQISNNASQWPILYLISKDNKEELSKLLGNRIENLDQKILGMEVTMMHAAAYYNSINIIGWLVTNNVDLAPKDQYSRTPHDIAILFNNKNASTLIEKSIKLKSKKIQNNKQKCMIL